MPIDTHTLQQTLIDRLDEARRRTWELMAPLSDEDARLQHDVLMSPIVWDLGHIAGFEELWLLRNLDGPVEFGEMPGMFNPFENPRRSRGSLDLPSLAECRALMDEVRARVVDRTASLTLDLSNPLLRDGYVYSMVLQHEVQHNETILQTLQLKQGAPYAAPRRYVVPARGEHIEVGSMVRFAGGCVRLGTDDRSAAYDNERPSHLVQIQPFSIDVYPVTNGEYLEFMRDGGYARRELWSDAGWAWVQESNANSPKYWTRDGAGWCVRVMERTSAVDAMHPVCHVCFHEAEAFARFAGKRLPTEAEWETAASWDSAEGRARVFPWGNEPATPAHANVDQLSFGTAPVGSYEKNWSPLGCYGMIGDVWEWTSSDFAAYPGYQTFPYPEYSEVFFGPDYKVLKGGSWATRPSAIRNSFRNWDYPIRRQIFSGFRLARDG
ncbi:MAG: ergothioneine biosynthesis protein EgtB [Gemmatimonadaceae bacterium]